MNTENKSITATKPVIFNKSSLTRTLIYHVKLKNSSEEVLNFVVSNDRTICDNQKPLSGDIVGPFFVPECFRISTDNFKSSRLQYCFDGYVLSYFTHLLEKSIVFRILLLKHISRQSKDPVVPIYIILEPPSKHVLDLKWAKLINKLVIEKRELDHSFSWLSTLGGAYSSLGNYVIDFAMVAGRLSFKQLQLALRLGDKPNVIRCRLYYSLSLIQQKKLKEAKKIIQSQYIQAKNLPIEDAKLINICHGLWSRLKYEWELKKRQKTNEKQIPSK